MTPLYENQDKYPDLGRGSTEIPLLDMHSQSPDQIPPIHTPSPLLDTPRHFSNR